METVENENIEIQLLIEAIYLKYGYDLRHHAKAFLKRRILRRLSLSKFNSISEMQDRLLDDTSFFETLLLDLSISVTEMFRDPSFYRALRQEVIPVLKTYPFIKIWHAGCATGEEIYSMAILLKEEGLYKRAQIYATDFNEIVLQKARAGIYPIGSLKKYISNYQKSGVRESFVDYFTADNEYVVMNKSLKENIVFAEHNLLTDGVFNEMNLILCRNVLIYFDKALQDRVVGLFRDSLCHNGFLCLGSKESLRFSECADDFEEVVKTEKIYRKKWDEKLIPPSPPFKKGGIKGRFPDEELNRQSKIENKKRWGDFRMKYEAVVIGVSAGGMKALHMIFSSIAGNFALPVIVVQHQHPTSDNYLVSALNERCQLTVKEAGEKEGIIPGVVYIAPPNYHLMIEEDRTFSLSVFEPVNYARPSIDVLFETAAEAYGARLIGIILTGANNDGSQGLKRIKEMGGFTIVQDPATAEVDAMPKAAMAAAEADYVLTLKQIGPFLVKLTAENAEI